MHRDKKKDGSTVLTSGLTLNDIYPVGSIIMSIDSANPAARFGGTWVVFAQGRMIVGVDPLDVSFDAVQETGGAKTKAVPAHTHTTPAHTHTDNFSMGGPSEVYTNNTITGAASRAGPNHVHTLAGGVTSSGAGVSGAATGAAFDVMNPYITAYIWRRTA